MGIIDNLKKIFIENNGDDQEPKNKLLRNIVILGMIGVLLFLIGDLFADTNNSSPNVEEPAFRVNEAVREKSYAEKLSSELEEIISLINGVGEVKVKVYTSIGSNYVYEYDEKHVNKVTNEVDQSGGERQIEEVNLDLQMVVIRGAEGHETPVVRMEKFPVISGVLIVAQGAEVSEIKNKITRSISSLLNLSIHKINVLPFQGR